MWIITGATGFIGSALVWELNENGLTDLLLVDHISPDQRPGILKKRQYADFILANDLEKSLAEAKLSSKIKGVLHMGACSTTTETDEDYLRRNNVEYSQMLFRFCTQNKIPYIYASSAATYGDGGLGFDDLSDSRQFKPLNLYGWSKLKFDIWAKEQKATPPHWYGLRFFNVYGPNEYHKGEQSSVVFKAFNQIRDTGKLKLFKSHNPDYKDGHQLRDFVYIKDITRWVREMMTAGGIDSGIYNMGFGQARTWVDLATQTFKNMNKPLQIDWIEIPPNIRNQYQYFTEAKMGHLMSQKISRPQWSLEKGVEDYVKNFLIQADPHL